MRCGAGNCAILDKDSEVVILATIQASDYTETDSSSEGTTCPNSRVHIHQLVAGPFTISPKNLYSRTPPIHSLETPILRAFRTTVYRPAKPPASETSILTARAV